MERSREEVLVASRKRYKKWYAKKENYIRKLEYNKVLNRKIRKEMGDGWTRYMSIHRWVVKILGKPMSCSICKSASKKRYEWSNKDHKYRLNTEDWQRVCSQCHATYDRIMRTKT